MSRRAVTTRIDTELCIGCGSCVEVCPSDTLELRGDVAAVTGDESLNCGHCQAICPTGAVTVGALDPEVTRYDSFEADHRWLPHGQPDTPQLVRLMASRRSCRNFRDAPVDRKLLVDLAKIGATAASGTNSQRWRFALLEDRAAVLALGQRVASFYRALNWLVERRALRLLASALGRRELEHYRSEYADRIREGLDEWDRGGRDRLFHGAPATLLVSALADAATPTEDALLAAGNIMLAAHSIGLGTCLIGFAVEAIARDPRLRRWLELAPGERVHAVIALGHPVEVYERTAGRLPLPIRFVGP